MILFTLSLRARRRGGRNFGKRLSFAGAPSMLDAASVGGHLSFAGGASVRKRS
jgi:hypothetical protein